ncbi:MAG: transketolase C-terminal domain-containing protein [Candidatus Njordarchaeales archaeon]
MMPRIDVITGNDAAAWGARLSRVEVIAAYPITPQTTIVETLSKWVDTGEMKAKFITVESEHSAMAAIIGASAAGARAFTATSSHGFFYMFEMISWAVGARVPVVMAVVDRAMAPPWNIWADWNDALAARDLGWIMFFASNNQEVLDTIIQAYKIAEDKNVLLPAMVCLEGFVLSHTTMPVTIHDQEKVDEYLPSYEPPHYVVNPKIAEPLTYGNILFPWDYAKVRLAIQKSMDNAVAVIKKASQEFKEIFGTWHGDLIKEYKTDNAEYLIISMGTVAEEAEAVVDKLREKGMKIGAIKVRAFRPFPKQDIVKAIKDVSKVFVVDRDISFGYGGILAGEIKAVFHDNNIDVPVKEAILGIGGDEILPEHIEKFVLENR